MRPITPPTKESSQERGSGKWLFFLRVVSLDFQKVLFLVSLDAGLLSVSLTQPPLHPLGKPKEREHAGGANRGGFCKLS